MKNGNAHPFGICSLKLRLKDYTDYSIVYQIYVNNKWQTAVANGTETMLATNIPMSAFRVALIPTSEKQNQINTWNKDVGKSITN